MVKSIKVPATPKSAYQPKRKVSNLLKAHITNLEAVTQRKYGGGATRRPKTEGQASAYIAELTRRLHAKSPSWPPAPVAPVAYAAPAAPPALAVQPASALKKPPRRRPKRSKKTSKASKRARRAGAKK